MKRTTRPRVTTPRVSTPSVQKLSETFGANMGIPSPLNLWGDHFPREAEDTLSPHQPFRILQILFLKLRRFPFLRS